MEGYPSDRGDFGQGKYGIFARLKQVSALTEFKKEVGGAMRDLAVMHPTLCLTKGNWRPVLAGTPSIG
ncbi:hypothetical protein AK812_SmicGene10938 [Symbiodinium microadriaticum]|uniref:Uncharacterized protein n=1 Tax=Symbiodinium microadriaticum TaxID=2951 RepID=A0A1Q9EEH5_SYMMI|nr:hypothetical protein AK812_SmicGene10938 [Symbiodinium microadriaticum]